MNAEAWRCVSCPVKEKQKLTAPGIPRRSPIQVLTGPTCLASEIGRDRAAQGGMAVSEYNAQMPAI